MAWWTVEKHSDETLSVFLERNGLMPAEARASLDASTPPKSAVVDFQRLWSQQGIALSKERSHPVASAIRRPPAQRLLSNAPTAPIIVATKDTKSMGPLVLSGKTFGQYLLQQPLPSAPNGILFQAEDLLLGRTVVVKIVAPEHLPGGLRDAPRFLQRVLASSRVAHPNCHTVLAAGQHDGWFYVAMPMMAGGSALDRVRAHGARTPREATRCCKMATRGLAAAHAAGIVHGNVKPSNVLWTKTKSSSPILAWARMDRCPTSPRPVCGGRSIKPAATIWGACYAFHFAHRPPRARSRRPRANSGKTVLGL